MIALISPALSDHGVVQDLPYDVAPHVQANARHHIVKREPTTLTAITGFLTTAGPIIGIVLVVIFGLALALYLFVFIIVLIVGGPAAVAGSALVLIPGGRKKREANLYPFPSFDAMDPEMFGSIINSIRWE